MPLPVGSISYSIHRANAKKKAQTLAIRSQAHHKPNILWDKSAPLWARSQCIFFCPYLFEVVIRERLSKYVCIPRCRCKCTQNIVWCNILVQHFGYFNTFHYFYKLQNTYK